MKKVLLYFLMFIFTFSFNLISLNNAFTMQFKNDEILDDEFQLTEREVAKIAFTDFINQIELLPELGLRVILVTYNEEEKFYNVTLAIYDKITNEVITECAIYTINSKTGKILEVKKLFENKLDFYSILIAKSIVAQKYETADKIINYILNINASEAEFIIKNAKNIVMSYVINGQSDENIIKKFFDRY